jgi:predicted Fe-Mo cluster-binding NifX family protein/MinD-like ATPase involved in chromosome partitioning or flagellar assembly
MLGLGEARLASGASGAIEPLDAGDGLKVVSVGMMLNSRSDAVVWRGPMKYNVIRQFLTDVAWGDLDDLVIDSPPGTGDEPLAVAQLVGRDAKAVIVTTPQDIAIADVRRSVSFCRMLSLEILGIVENMSGLSCPHCGETVDVFGSGGGQALAAEMGVGFLGRVPLDPHVVRAADAGCMQTDDPVARAFAVVADRLTTAPDAETRNTPEDTKKRKDERRMKIAIPTAEGRLCPHFGHCQQFAIVTLDEAGKTIAGVEYLTPPPHEPGVLPRWLSEQGANVIIAGGMGQRAQMLFDQCGIDVVVGVLAGKPEDIVAAWIDDRLEAGANICDH